MSVEVLSERDWFEECVGEQSEDADVIRFLRQQAGMCVRLLRKELGLSQEGAIYEVRKFLKLEPLRYCQSPIEKLIMAGFLGVDWRPFMTIPPTAYLPGKKSMPKGDLIIAPQFPYGPYTLDFLLFGRDDRGNQRLLNVECDGKQHHNTTMDQRDYDRERNKFMRDNGIEVIRWSGSDICKQPAAAHMKPQLS